MNNCAIEIRVSIHIIYLFSVRNIYIYISYFKLILFGRIFEIFDKLSQGRYIRIFNRAAMKNPTNIRIHERNY